MRWRIHLIKNQKSIIIFWYKIIFIHFCINFQKIWPMAFWKIFIGHEMKILQSNKNQNSIIIFWYKNNIYSFLYNFSKNMTYGFLKNFIGHEMYRSFLKQNKIGWQLTLLHHHWHQHPWGQYHHPYRHLYHLYQLRSPICICGWI